MSFAALASSGPLVVAVGVAVLAGLVSFLSPCVLPLVPGYLSYVTGMAGADLDAALGTDPHGRPVEASGEKARGRILAGGLLFVAGFTVVFTLTGVLVAQAGRVLLVHERIVEIAVGVLVIGLGLAFAGVVPGLQREVRVHRLPGAGLAGAPVLGAVFALSWTPCVGPTLGAVLGLAVVGGQTGRAVTLTVAYCLGLGLPFLAFGLGFRRLLGLFAVVRRHSRWVTRTGGVLLVLVGLALVTGGWTVFVDWLRATVGAGTVGI
ncbi:MAG: cytochrome C biogenesis protein ResC [Actinobacteria bacterium 13_1_20CM_3_71_11]|nr:MAG: cytochrome C biogenesis protein ResC [Actinobacteria bacterium 13_1_20CM_3_71_11]